MICIGAVIPNKKSCGIVLPVFCKDNQNRYSSTYFCVTDRDGKIIRFVDNTTDYSIIGIESKARFRDNIVYHSVLKGEYEYGIGDQAPIAFVYSYHGNTSVIVGNYEQMKEYLNRELINNEFPIEAKYKALRFLPKDKVDKRLKKQILVLYYHYLHTINPDYAEAWRKDETELKECSKERLLVEYAMIIKTRSVLENNRSYISLDDFVSFQLHEQTDDQIRKHRLKPQRRPDQLLFGARAHMNNVEVYIALDPTSLGEYELMISNKNYNDKMNALILVNSAIKSDKNKKQSKRKACPNMIIVHNTDS